MKGGVLLNRGGAEMKGRDLASYSATANHTSPDTVLHIVLTYARLRSLSGSTTAPAVLDHITTSFKIGISLR